MEVVSADKNTGLRDARHSFWNISRGGLAAKVSFENVPRGTIASSTKSENCFLMQKSALVDVLLGADLAHIVSRGTQYDYHFLN